MAFEKAARGETQRLWREEVPCALAFVRAEFQPSVWCVCVHVSTCISVCAWACTCVGYCRQSMRSKDYGWKRTGGRETGDDGARVQSCHLEGAPLRSYYLDRSVLYHWTGREQGFSMVSVWRGTSIIQVRRGENVPTVRRKGNSFEKKLCKHERSKYKKPKTKLESCVDF